MTNTSQINLKERSYEALVQENAELRERIARIESQFEHLSTSVRSLDQRVSHIEHITIKHEGTHRVTEKLLIDVRIALNEFKKDKEVIPQEFIDELDTRMDLTDTQKQAMYSYFLQYYREVSKYLLAIYIADAGIFEIASDTPKTDALMMLLHGVGMFAIDGIAGALAPYTFAVSSILIPVIGGWALDQMLGKYEGLAQKDQQYRLQLEFNNAFKSQNIELFGKSPHHAIHAVAQLMALTSLNQFQDLIKDMSNQEVPKFVKSITKATKQKLRRGNMPFSTPAQALARTSTKVQILNKSDSTRSVLRHSQVSYPDPISGEEIVCRLYVGETPKAKTDHVIRFNTLAEANTYMSDMRRTVSQPILSRKKPVQWRQVNHVDIVNNS